MKKKSTLYAFEKVKVQIGSCGIWCGSCVVGNGTLKEITKRYGEIVKSYGLEEWAPKDFDFQEFSKGLTSIQNIPLCPGCLNNGGRDNCEMRTCSTNKKLNDCIECYEQETCVHSELLHKMRTGARGAGLFVKTEDIDKKEFIKNWTAELKGKWPSCILFME